ncbi:putative bifunctional diguanylate cyclase/phosphodiesterase [Haliovirga abyssi]|uniref:EAL domain-containing protein n=1 Tax=Haliovirga abyssi TaxID=2996794 RepID=A0AAU9D8V6_9FUSO|nr:GGDEF domain-containing phosphodiesterase [Haliovirga abyssi]BDU49705.1 hypothetical protein HLVA_02740 [Haliovirga abyssi]
MSYIILVVIILIIFHIFIHKKKLYLLPEKNNNPIILIRKKKIKYMNGAAKCIFYQKEDLDILENEVMKSNYKEFEVKINNSYYNFNVSTIDKNSYNLYGKNITKLKETEKKLEITSKIFEISKDGILILDENFVIIAVNDAFTKISLFTEEEYIGKKIWDTTGLLERKEEFKNILKALLKLDYWEGETWFRKKTKEIYNVYLKIKIIRRNKKIINYIISIEDITYLNKIEQRTNFIKNYDLLTGLHNRNFIIEKVEKYFAENKKIYLLYLDIDNFKKVNDSLNYKAGDKILNDLSEYLKSCVNSSDELGRLEGDKFVLLYEEKDYNEKEILDKLYKIFKLPFKTYENPFLDEVKDVYLNFSLGIAYSENSNKSAFDLVKNAEIAMYDSKVDKKNSFRNYEKLKNRDLIKEVELESDLRKAIENDEFIVYYQPQIMIPEEKILGMEALIRWQSPKRGFVNPGGFIEFAEKSGLIVEIGEIVFEKSCKFFKELMENGRKDLLLSVNLSPLQFDDIDLIDKIMSIVEKYNIPTNKIKLEITESLIMKDMDNNIKKMEELKSLGFKFSMDDFGTGYSSLSYLKNFPLDFLKIDQSFIRNLRDDESDKNLVKAILDIGKIFKLGVIAEGVETKEQLEFLKGIGVTEIQGYYYSKPISDTEFIKFLEKE